MKKLFKSCVSLLLVACMLLGVVPATMLTAHAAEEKKTIIYASLGDSMTNGYCLPGYDGESGAINYGVDSYANQFAAYLAGYTGGISDDQVIFNGTKAIVDHRPLALSGMRAQDIDWALRLDYTNETLIADAYAHNRDVSSFNSAWWYSKFNTGDYFTWDELLNPDYRYGDAAAKILDVYNKNGNGAYYAPTAAYVKAGAIKAAQDGLKANPKYPVGSTHMNQLGNEKYLQISSEYYQRSVADADVISLGVGNTNFGTHMLSRILDVVMSDKDDFKSEYDLNQAYALAAKDPFADAVVKGFINGEYYKTVMLPNLMMLGGEDNGENSKADRIAYIVEYCTVSFITGYISMLNRILELNHDAHIIQIALMNAYEEPNGTVAPGTLGQLVSVIYDPMNEMLKELPAKLLASKSEADQAKYKDAKFYFAEAPYVSCMVDVFGDDFYLDANNNYVEYPGLLKGGEDYTQNTKSVVRDRFAEEIIYKERDALFSMVGRPKPNVGQAEFLAGVAAYELMTPVERALFAAASEENAALAENYAWYLALENALIRSGKENVTFEALSKLGQLDIPAITEDTHANIAAVQDSVLPTVFTALAKIVENVMKVKLAEYEGASLEGIQINTDVDIVIDPADIQNLVMAEKLPNADDAAKAEARNQAAGVIAHKVVKDVYVATVLLNGVNGIDQAFSKLVAFYKAADNVVMNSVDYYNFLHGTELKALDDAAKKQLMIDWAYDACEVDENGTLTQTDHYTNLIEYINKCTEHTSNKDQGSFVVQIVLSQAQDLIDKLVLFGLQLTSDEAIEAGMAEFKEQGLGDIETGIATELSANESLTYANVELLVKLLALPQALSDAMYDDDNMRGSLTMDARCVLGTGAGGHPSVYGHNALRKAIVDVFPSTCAFGHNYGKPVWNWAEDYKTATATFTCSADKTHVKTVAAQVTSNITDATCEADGKVTYSATVEFGGKSYSDEGEKVIEKSGHKYGEPVWEWAEDYKTATATFTCANDEKHIKTVNADITSVTDEATCEADGQVTYTAAVEIGGKTYSDDKVKVIGQTGHNYGEAVWKWAEDYKSATATFTCVNDEKHVEIVDAKITSNTTDATCEADGKVIYTATVEFGGKSYSDEEEKVIDETGHKYGEPVWSWAEDYKTATATFTCANDENHVETVDATITSVTVKETCEVDGKITYTATVEFGGKTYSDDEIKVINHTGHDYEAAWQWAEDNSDAVVTLTCKNDETHVEKPEVTVTSMTTDATCDDDGKTVYTATAKFEDDTYTDTEEVTIPAAHKFGDWTTEGAVTKRVCSACGYTESKITTTDGNVEIELPKQDDGLNLNVEQVSEESDERYILVEETFEEYAEEEDIAITVLKTFDITLENKDGVHQQPDGTLKVKLPLGSDKDGNYKVYRVNDDGTLTDMEATRQGSHMVFDTDHLSLYVIIEINEHKHDLKLNKAVEATCTDEGSKAYYTCSNCDLWFEDAEGTTEIKDKTSVVIPALGHDWKDATCTAPKTCSVCGETEGWRLSHTYEETVTEPTCTEKGYTTRTCSVCGHSYQIGSVDALGHSWDEGKVTIEATEDKAGERVFTCKTCEETKTEVIPALGHTHNYTSVVTAPTCTEKGYTTYSCACGHTYIADEVPATGHTIEKGICTVCGVEDPAEAGFFKLYGANMLLGNNLAMNFYIDPADLEFGEDYYAVITKEYADDRDDLVVKIDVEDWEEAYGMYRISLDKIAAKEMADDIIVVIYNGDDEQVSKTWVDSVRDYTMRMLKKEEVNVDPNEELLALYVEMLNYGAAAQTHFEYNENDLVNNELTAAQKTYGVGPVEMGDFRVKGTGYVGTNLTLESNILMNFFFNNIPAEHDDMYAIATYVDHYGKAQEIKIKGESFVKHDGSTWKISVAGLVIADCKELVTVKVFDANGNVVASVVDSIESYTARMDDDGPLYVAIMKFAVAAYESFH